MAAGSRHGNSDLAEVFNTRTVAGDTSDQFDYSVRLELPLNPEDRAWAQEARNALAARIPRE